MDTLYLSDLRNLANSEDYNEGLRKIFEWHHEREKTLTNWSLGFVASFLVAIIIALFKGEMKYSLETMLVIIAVLLLMSTYSIFHLWQMKNIPHQYAVSQRLIEEIRLLMP